MNYVFQSIIKTKIKVFIYNTIKYLSNTKNKNMNKYGTIKCLTHGTGIHNTLLFRGDSGSLTGSFP